MVADVLVGGDQHALQAALAALAVRRDDVAQAERHGLADRTLEVAGRAQAALETGAGDLERVVAAHRVVVVELARRSGGWRGRWLSRSRPSSTPAGRVDRDPQRAAAELEVVQVELQVGDDRGDQALDLRSTCCVSLIVVSLPVLSRRASCCDLGLSVKKAWTPRSPRLRFSELQGPIEYIGWRVVFRRRRNPAAQLRHVDPNEVPAVLRMSTMFLRTLREDPADAEVASHRLLVRAGYIRRAAPGGFTWLPLGWIVYQNVERIVREEMDRAGFQEVHFPALLPREPYELSGRWTDYGDNVFRLKDRKGADMMLAPTHEEMFTLLVKDLYSSYKDLPLVIYQIQTKFRDEARPRAGLLRGREFVMKDSYSFDIDDEGLRGQLPAAPRRLPAHVRPARPALRDRVGDERRDGRLGQRGVPGTDGGRRGHLRALHQLRLRGQHRGGAGRRCRQPIPFDDAARRRMVHDTPDTPTIQTLVDLINARDDLRRADRDVDRRRHAEERGRQAAPSRRHGRAAGRSACPATARST